MRFSDAPSPWEKDSSSQEEIEARSGVEIRGKGVIPWGQAAVEADASATPEPLDSPSGSSMISTSSADSPAPDSICTV